MGSKVKSNILKNCLIALNANSSVIFSKGGGVISAQRLLFDLGCSYLAQRLPMNYQQMKSCHKLGKS